ncbi:MAG: hypothetical protein ACXWI2_02975 [Croceibacterium sp.]
MTLSWGSSEATSAHSECLFAFASQTGTPRFEEYQSGNYIRRPNPPRITGPEARRYRTAIARGAAVGVNFAGHYTIVGWGCGSSCLDWAIVDRVTGTVHFDPRYRIVSTLRVADDLARTGKVGAQTFGGLVFRRDSNLLVVQGAPHEDQRREGLSFLDWTGHKFRPVAFVPASKICVLTPIGPSLGR